MIAIITQARINSSRLPNKIFLTAKNKPFLAYHIEALKKTGFPIFVATTNDGSEKPIIAFCEKYGISSFKGDEHNVLLRFYNCALTNKIDTIIRVTSDCPLINSNIILKGIQEYQNARNQTNIYLSNTMQRTYALGMDFEIFSFELLKDAFYNAEELAEKEHVTPYIWRNKSKKTEIKQILDLEDNSHLRLTLDTEADRQLLTTLIENYGADKLSYKQLVSLLNVNKSLQEINAHIEQKKI